MDTNTSIITSTSTSTQGAFDVDASSIEGLARSVVQTQDAEKVKTRRGRALLCSGVVVILSGIIIGIVFGTRDTSPSRLDILSLSELFVDYNVSIQALQDVSSPQYEALVWMANSDSADLQRTMSNDELVERFVMVLLYFPLGMILLVPYTPPGWWAPSGPSPSTRNCMWNTGCNAEGSVVYLSLDSNDGLLSGSLPTEIGLLSNLQELSMRNSLTGTIPSELGQISALNRLTLRSTAALTGTIPSELGQSSTLRYLLLDYNALTGTIPSELGLISTLKVLQLNSNALTGTIPSELGQISTLESLWVQSNALTGTLPTELGRVWFLQV